MPDAVRALPNLRALSLGPTVRTPPWLAGFSRLVELELARPVGEMPPLPATLRIIRHGDGPPDLDHVRGLPHLADAPTTRFTAPNWPSRARPGRSFSVA